MIRKATRAPLSSLEIIDDVFEPKRLAKIVQVPSKDRAKISISAATPAEIEAEIKHGMEAAPDY
ncbi:hypothetical protein [Arcanobacterium hippocoleae]|uniref:hypothetical protein n=1 Tax=Arcanobacterium hippocoleae TaxID=149017 RepID=UPI00334165DD